MTYVNRSKTVHNLLCSARTLCMNYVTKTVLLVSSSVRNKELLCFVHGQGQKSEQTHTEKNFVRLRQVSTFSKPFPCQTRTSMQKIPSEYQ